jgi:hypothetical protein
MPSNWSLDVRITLSAFALRCETEMSPPCLVMNQRSVVVPDVRSIRREPSARSRKPIWTAPREPFEELLDGFAHDRLRARRADVRIESSSAGRSITRTA